MNRINPLYIGALLVMLLMLSLYLLSGAKQSLLEEKESFKQTQKIANELSGLKKTYANQKKSKRSIQRILAQPSLKLAEIKAEYKKSGLKLHSKSIDKRGLDFLMGKLLNASYDIRKLKIKRLGDEQASFELEIKW